MVPAPGGRAGGLRALGRSFAHAWDGLVEAAMFQRNMRIHLALGAIACAFAAAAPIQPVEAALLYACVGLVVAAEAANTALEGLVDLLAPEIQARARTAKDAAAAAVLVLAVASVLVAAAIAVHAWPALRRDGPALALPLAAGAGIATAIAVLGTAALPRAAYLAALAGGLALVVAIARAASVTGAAGALGALAVAADAARRRARDLP